MKLIVLVENNTLIDQYYGAEPALSFYIETENNKILFDTGYSGLFIKNAQDMGINLANIDNLILSHGHNDHTGGLKFLLKEKVINPKRKVKLITHPNSLIKKNENGLEIGIDFPKEELENIFKINLSKKPVWITDELVYLGEIPRTIVTNRPTIGYTYNKNNKPIEDRLIDDSALVYKSNQGLVIITGCSHSGIANIVDYATKICNSKNILDIVGGFHILNENSESMIKEINHLMNYKIRNMHPCHCTDLNAKIFLSKYFKVEEVGVGLELEW